MALLAARPAIANTGSDRDSHGVSDPPDARGAISGAHGGVAHAMVSCPPVTAGSAIGRQRAPPALDAHVRAVAQLRAIEIVKSCR